MSAALAQEWFTRAAFGLAGLIHLLPLAGLLGRSALEKAYGVRLESSDLVILMKHRALLFGLIAAACWIAVWQSAWRWPAGIMALVSMLGFVWIASMQSHQAAIAKIVWIDVAAAVPLLLALLLQAMRRADPW
jgi:hypothetical protein